MLTLPLALIAGLLVPRADVNGDPLPPGALARYGDYHKRGGDLGEAFFSPDGKTLVRRREYAYELIDLATGKEVTPPHLQKSPQPQFHYLHDGRHLLFRDRRCWIADPHTGERKLDIAVPGAEVVEVETSPDGKAVLLTTFSDGHRGLAVLDPAAAKPTAKTVEVPAPVRWALGPGGKRLYSWSHNPPALTVADVSTGRTLATLPTSPDPHGLVATADDRWVLLWCGNRMSVFNVTADGLGEAKVFKEVNASPTPATLDDTHLILASGETLDVESGKIAPIAADHRKQQKPGRLDVYPTADGKLFAEVHNRRDVVVWVAATGKTVRRFDTLPEPTLAVPTDGGKVVAVADSRQVVRRFDAATGRPLGSFDRPQTDDGEGWVMPFDGVLVRVSGGEVTATAFDPKGKEEVTRFDLGLAMDGRREPVAHLEVRPDLDRALVAVGDKVAVIEFGTGKRLGVLAAPGMAAAYSPDGRLIAVARHRELTLIEARTGKVRRTFSYDTPPKLFTRFDRGATRTLGPPHGLIRFTSAGDRLALFADGGFWVWDTDGELVASCPQVNTSGFGGSSCGALRADGRWLAVSDGNRFAVHGLREPTQTKREVPLPGGLSRVRSAEFTPAGRLLTTHDDGLAYLWDVDALAAIHRRPRPLDADDALWAGLADADGVKAGRAVEALARDPALAVRVLADRLTPESPVDDKQLARCIEQLGHTDFNTREAAEKELTALGDVAAGALRAAAAKADSPEQSRRLERLLAGLDAPQTDPERVRRLRAVEVLERAGTADARRLLRRMADGPPGTAVAAEAAAALKRLR